MDSVDPPEGKAEDYRWRGTEVSRLEFGHFDRSGVRCEDKDYFAVARATLWEPRAFMFALAS